MPSVSRSQQRLMGVVHAYQKDGSLPKDKEFAKKVKDIASGYKKKKGKGKTKGIDYDAADEFASTKHKGLPDKIKKEALKAAIKKIIREFLTEGRKTGYIASRSSRNTSTSRVNMGGRNPNEKSFLFGQNVSDHMPLQRAIAFAGKNGEVHELLRGGKKGERVYPS